VDLERRGHMEGPVIFQRYNNTFLFSVTIVARKDVFIAIKPMSALLRLAGSQTSAGHSSSSTFRDNCEPSVKTPLSSKHMSQE
jgi:hypothetical protein